MMSRDEMYIRAGFYVGLAVRDLNDPSYWHRWAGNAQNLTPVEYAQMASEIHARLLAAGKIRPDEDPVEELLRELL